MNERHWQDGAPARVEWTDIVLGSVVGDFRPWLLPFSASHGAYVERRNTEAR